MKSGDVCLANYPFTDASGTKLRPVVVVSADKFNVGQDIVVLPISSQPEPNDSFSVFVGRETPNFGATGLRYDSAVKWTKPLTIAKSVLARKLGHLPDPLFTMIRVKLRSMFVD